MVTHYMLHPTCEEMMIAFFFYFSLNWPIPSICLWQVICHMSFNIVFFVESYYSHLLKSQVKIINYENIPKIKVVKKSNFGSELVKICPYLKK